MQTDETMTQSKKTIKQQTLKKSDVSFSPIFRSRGEGPAKWVDVQGVDGAEVASNAAELLSVYRVKESRLELALTRRSYRHTLRVLTTAQ